MSISIMPMPELYYKRTYVHLGGFQYLNPLQIIRLQAERNYTRIYLVGGSFHLVSLTLLVLEERLQSYDFVRISRGNLINKYHISKCSKDGTVELSDGTLLRPSRRKKGVLEETF